MSRSSRKHRRVTPVSVAPQETHRKLENLRDGLPIARARRQYDLARQFVPLPPSRLEMPDDFARNYQEIYTRVDGRPADVVQGLPRNRNNVRVRESNLQEALHAYFQDSPELVSECERRTRRRRVLFALQRTRKGSGSGKKHNWTELSKVRCV